MRCYYKNPDKFRARHAKRRDAGGFYTDADVKFLYKAQKGLCICCKKSLDGIYHVDHRVAIKNGGTNDKKNLDLLCPKCNMRKGAKDNIVFMRTNGYLC